MSDSRAMLGYQISHAGLHENAEYAWSRINGDRLTIMACANPHSIVVAEKDECFRSALKDADLLLPDGIGVVVGAKILGLPIQERVAGFEFFTAICRKAEQRGGVRFFFLGSSEKVLKLIEKRMHKEYPGIQMAGIYSPPFKSEFSEEDTLKMIEAINAVQPHVLWVGMTAPKQEKWLYQNRDSLNVGFAGSIGAVFDFYAGTKYRSPEWVRNIGMEWLPRLMMDFKRLWRRNFISSPLFLLMVIKSRFLNEVNEAKLRN